MKKILFFLIIVLMTLVAVHQDVYAQGTGTASDPFLINGKSELIAFRTGINSGSKFYYTPANTFSTTNVSGSQEIPAGGRDKYFKLAVDVVLNTGNVAGCDGVKDPTWESWTTIGTDSKPFYGHFDGGFHLVSGMFLDRVSATSKFGGFFGIVADGATVRNLGIVNSYVRAGQFVGGIASEMLNDARMVKCFFSGTIEGLNSYVGGLVGHAQSNVVIDTCYATGSLYGASYFTGGFVGQAENITINNSYSSIIVTCDAGNVGGLVGNGSGNVANSSYFDVQMANFSNGLGTPMITNDMISNTWSSLGDGFVVSGNAYPYIDGFNIANNDVRVSTVYIKLPATNSSNYTSLNDLRDPFDVSNQAMWDISNTRYGTLSGTTVDLICQGFFALTATISGSQKVFNIFSNKDPKIGTEANPFYIDDLAELQKFRAGINSGAPFMYDHYKVPSCGVGTYFMQTVDITMPTGNWTPIGDNSGHAFRGTYDGGNHEIVGMKTNGSNQGLFGFTQGSTIKNVIVRDANITSSATTQGILCARTYGGTFDNCHVKGSTVTTKGQFGAIVGYTEADSLFVLNCSNDCNFNVTANNPVGGIIGYIVDSKYVLIRNCVNKGNLTGAGCIYLGGIVGRVHNGHGTYAAEIEYCHNSGNISSTAGSPADSYGPAGIAGLAYQPTTLRYCSNSGNITGVATAFGICCYSAVANHCINTGNVTLISGTSSNQYMACGICSGTANSCLNTGTISASRASAIYGVAGTTNYCVNAGEMETGASSTARGVINKTSYNIGNVTGMNAYGASYASGNSGTSDIQRSPNCLSTTRNYNTSQMLGTGLQSYLGTDKWVYTNGMYPRIKGLENHPVMIAAATPVNLATGENVNEVATNFTLACNDSVKWSILEGFGVTSLSSCSGGLVTATLANPAVAGPVVLGVGMNDSVYYTVTLNQAITAPTSDLLVENLADLKLLREGVNSGNSFTYHGTPVPVAAKGVTFRLTADLDISDTLWVPIGNGSQTPFSGVFNGDNHKIDGLTQSGNTMGGLFGWISKGEVRNLDLTNVSITQTNFQPVGSVTAILQSGRIDHCTADGEITPTVLTTSYVPYDVYIGGIVGRAYGTITDKVFISNCVNRCNITATTKHTVGGIVSRGASYAYCLVDTCINYGNIIAGGSTVTGIVGFNATADHCVNAGKITGTATSSYVGGVAGYNSKVIACVNTGDVTGEFTGISSTTCVGGVIAAGYITSSDISVNYSNQYKVSYSVNTGIVTGNNRTYTGGISGYALAEYCYNANSVSGNNATGAIIAREHTGLNQNYYDAQHCRVKGIGESDVAGKAEGKLTSEMTGTGLESALGSTYYTYTTGLYPRIKSLKDTDAVICSASPLLLSGTETIFAIGNDVHIGGCTQGAEWSLESGNCMTFDCSAGTGTITGRGVVYANVSMNGQVLKRIYMAVNITRDNPLVIKDSTQFINFRAAINGSGYYYCPDMTFKSAAIDPSFTPTSNDIEIVNGGEELYFKLICDLNLSGHANWSPVGTPAQPFKGFFNGDNHLISNLNIGTGDTLGLFGEVEKGGIERVCVSGTISGSGAVKGLLCGYNNAGVIEHCVADNATMEGKGTSVGLIMGLNAGTIDSCSVKNSTVNISGQNCGGLCGYNRQGVIHASYYKNLTLESVQNNVGGLCGYDYNGSILNSYGEDSKLTFTNGLYLAGIVGHGYSNTVRYSYIKNVDIEYTGPGKVYSGSSTGAFVAGIQGYQENSSILGGNRAEFCYTEGGSLKSKANFASGIVANYNWSTSPYINDCVNNMRIEGTSYVSGIGRGPGMNRCRNYANVIGSGNYVGGISNDFGYIYDCYNACDTVKGINYVGGVVGGNSSTILERCFNDGLVIGSQYVGGVVGNLGRTATDCYNAGMVQGKSYVGGVAGRNYNGYSSHSIQRCYNSGVVEGNAFVGGVAGIDEANDITNCFYDSQTSWAEGGINGADVAGVAEGRKTAEMLGTGLQSGLSSNYVYADGLYPRQKKFKDDAATVLSAMPLNLPETLTVRTIHSSTPYVSWTAAGCDSVTYTRLSGQALTVSGCTFTVANSGIVYASVRLHDAQKLVKFAIGISEEHPIIVKNLEQFQNLRNYVNSGAPFYYSADDQAFYANPDPSYMEVPAGGAGMYFRLDCDINLSGASSWDPIGNTSANNFQGYFMGNNHTVTLPSTAMNYMGLFGYSSGEIRDLTVKGANINSNKTYTGALCGFNNGVIRRCSAVEGTVKGSGANTGGLVGYTESGIIQNCYNDNDVICTATSGTNYVGGVAGRMASGQITSCFNMGDVTTNNTGTSYAGGVVGHNNAILSQCYNVGKITGNTYVAGVAGWNDNTSFTECWNAGQVIGGDGIYVSAITNSTNSLTYPTKSAYDHQMCVKPGGVDPGTVSSMDPINASKSTLDMTGNALSGVLTSGNWVFTDGLYPRLLGLDTLPMAEDASLASAATLFLVGSQNVRDVATTFTVSLPSAPEDVVWDREGYGNCLNIDNINTTGSVRVTMCGTDALKVSKNRAEKIIELVVQNIEALAAYDTTCGEPYQWSANSRFYTTSGEYVEHIVIGDGCDSILALHLQIPDYLAINMDQHDVNCNGGYGHATANVTGGWNSYLYAWTNEAGDTISRAATVNNLRPGTYTVVVNDAVRPVCQVTKSIEITEPTKLIVDSVFFDAGCYNSTEGSYVTFDVNGGVLPYTITWSGAASGTQQMSDSGHFRVEGLVDGTYQFRIADDHTCIVDTTVMLQDTDDLYEVRAYSLTKVYDAVEVNPYRYTLKIGSGSVDTLTAGVGYKLPTGDTLYVDVTATTPLVDVSVTSNDIVECRISRDGVDRTCRYNLHSYNSFVTINKRNVTLTSCSDTKEYDGNELTCRTVTVSGDGFIGVGQDTLSCTVTGTRTNAGTSDNTFTYTLTTETNPNNYNITTVNGALTVTPAGGGLVFSAKSDSIYYNGSALAGGFTFAGTLASGETAVVTYDVTPSITDAGVLVYRITDWDVLDASSVSQKANYTNVHIDSVGTLKVKPLQIQLYSESAVITYNDDTLTRPTVTVVGDNGIFAAQTSNLRATGKAINYTATPVPNTIAFDKGTDYKDANYDITYNEGTLTVNRKDLTVTGESNTLAYNGSEQSITNITVSGLVSGHQLTGLTYAATGMTEGTYNGNFSGTAVVKKGTEDVTGNYNISTTPGTLTITATTGQVLIVSGKDSTHIYDNTEYTYHVYTVSYNGTAATEIAGSDGKKFLLSTGDTVTITPSGEGLGRTDAGSFNNEFTYTLTNAASYSNVKDSVNKVYILKRPVTLTSSSFSKNYDGTEITKEVCLEGGYLFVTGQGATYTFNGHNTAGGAYINVGSYPNIFQYTLNAGTDAANYVITLDTGMLTVNKAQAIVVAADTNRVYGDENPTPFLYSILNLQNGETEASLRAAGTLTGNPILSAIDEMNGNAPVTNATTTENNPYTIYVDLNDLAADNYNFVAQNGRLTIQGRKLKIIVRSYTTEYDGLAHDYTGTTAPHYDIDHTDTLRPGDNITNINFNGDVRFTGNNDITFSNVTIMNGTEDVTGNYNITGENGHIVITRVPLALKPMSVTVTYDGNLHGQPDLVDPYFTFFNSTNLVSTDTIHSFVLTGNNTEAGSYVLAFDSAQLVIWNRAVDMNYYEGRPNASYIITFDTAKLIIEKSRDYTVNPPAVLTKVYDGTAFQPVPTITDTVPGNTFTFEYSVDSGHTWNSTIPSLIDVDTVYVMARVTSNNYVDTMVKYTFSVTPADLTIKLDSTKVFDGTQALNDYTVDATCFTVTGLVSRDHITAGSVQSRLANVGTYIMPYSATEDSCYIATPFAIDNGTNNYNISYEFTQRITTAPLAIKLDTSKVYDGEVFVSDYASTADGYTITGLVSGDAITAGTVKSASANVAVYTDSAATDYASIDVTFETTNGIGNYDVTYDFKQEILQRAITITAATDSAYYTGDTLRKDSAFVSVGTLAATDTLLDVTVKGWRADLGDTANIASDAVIVRKGTTGPNLAGNYAITYQDGLLRIKGTLAPLTFSSDSATWEYDGVEHYSHNYVVTFDGDTLHADATGLKFVIPLTKDTVTITPLSSITNVDTIDNDFSYTITNPATYLGTRDTTKGTLAVTPRAITLTAGSATREYDGTWLTKDTVMITSGSLASTDTLRGATVDGAQYHFGSSLNVPSDAVIVRKGTTGPNLKDNYAITYANGTLEVTARAVSITVTSDDAEKNYDGTPLTAEHYTVSGDALVSGDTIIAEITGTITDPGDSINRIAGYKIFRLTSMIPARPTARNLMYAIATPTGYTEVTDNYSALTLKAGTLRVYDSLIVVSVDSTDVTCYGLADGSAKVAVDGGKPVSPAYTYTVTGPTTVPSGTTDSLVLMSGLEPGLYTVVVKDALDSTVTVTFTIRQPDTMVAALSVPTAGCPNQPEYAVSVTVTGGNTGAKTYVWSKDANDVNADATTVTGVKPDCGHEYAVKVLVTDSKGCTAVDSATFIMNDTELPVFTFVPDDTTLYKDAGCNADTTTSSIGLATATDNCTSKPVITYVDQNFNSTCPGSYSFDRVWTVKDSCDNEATATQKVTVLDTVKPTFTVPANDTLCRVHPSQAISADPSLTGEPTGQSDNCTDAATLVAHTTFTDLDTTGTDDDLRVIEREWTVTDACGNSTMKKQYIAIRPAINTGNTTITCPPAIDITMWYGACDTLLNIGIATATTTVTDPAVADHLHITATFNGEVISTDAAGEWRFPEGDNVVTWTVTDTCGFSLSCEQHVVVNFPPCGPGHEVDYDGHTYQTVRVGCECWLKENLRNTKYADGTDVPSYSSYEHSSQNEADFGMLYSWYSTMKVAEWDNNAQPSTLTAPNGSDYIQGICPAGWAVPTDAQYDNLWYNGYGTEGIKDMDGRYWLPGLAGTTPNCGFNARGAGYYDVSVNRYYNLLGEAYFWTGDPVTTVTEGHCSVITMTCPQMLHTVYPKGHGHSVRCVQKQ